VGLQMVPIFQRRADLEENNGRKWKERLTVSRCPAVANSLGVNEPTL